MQITAYDLAKRYEGIKEIPGMEDHPLILWWHSLVSINQATKEETDEIPWCSSFINGICWELDLPRTETARARHWLMQGIAVNLEEAKRGFDVVIFKRGKEPQPEATVVNAPGHVAFYHSHTSEYVQVLGGNQSNEVKHSSYATSRVLGVRRLYLDV